MNILLCLLLLSQDSGIKLRPATGNGFAKIEVTTKTYEILTDVDARTAKYAAQSLENIHRAFVTEFKDDLEKSDGRLTVHLYKKFRTFTKIHPMAQGAGGFYDPNTKTLHIPVEQPRKTDDWKWVLLHEATHQLLHMRMNIGGQGMATGSVWFNEGFASYWASTKWKGKKIITGGVYKPLLKELRQLRKRKKLLSINKLVSGRPNMMAMRTYYAQGWALCHFLRHGKYKERFSEFLKVERKGRVTLGDFKTAFDIRDIDAFEKEFLNHVDKMGSW